MPEYSKLYFSLFNAITDACRALRTDQKRQALGILESAQLKTEAAYLDAPDETPSHTAVEERLCSK